MNRFCFKRGLGLGVAAAVGLAAGAQPALATITAVYDATTRALTVTCDAAGDFVTITANSAADEVNVSGVAIQGGPVLALDVARIIVQGSPGDTSVVINPGQPPQTISNLITLTQIGPDNFPALSSITINGGGGHDQIFGSALNDSIIDPDGGDFFTGLGGSNAYLVNMTGAGDPTIIGGGLGTLTLVGTPGDDLFDITGNSAVLGARSVNYDSNITTLVVNGDSGNDVFNVLASVATVYQINGEAGNDTLNYDCEFMAAAQTATSITRDGRKAVNFATVEVVNLLNLPGQDNGNSNGEPDNGNANGDSNNANANGDSNANVNSGGGDNTNVNSGGGDNTNTNSVTPGGSDDGSGQETPNGDETGDDGLGDVIEEANDCGLMCGPSFAPLMPLLFAGLMGVKINRKRARRG